VVDFLDVYVGKYHWPAFNIADTGITIGALAFIVSFYKRNRRRPRK
jgi:signal peptidase II